MSILDKVNTPNDIKNLSIDKLKILCTEIRDFLITNVSQTGGHLSSNLGTVELTVALHCAFNTPTDKFVFDVGHQCYTHKILTGRKNEFKNLRKCGGLSGFPSPRESEHDSFIAGHGNIAISAAIGLARAKKLQNETGKVIAIVGDGAFTGGMVYEGINNIDTLDNLIVVLNDNKMSISKNVGAVAKYLTKLRTSPAYFRAKRNMESALDNIPLIGKPIKVGIQAGKSTLRRAIYKSTWFEEMGFQYIGPVDGNNIEEMVELFKNINGQQQETPIFVNAITVKGKGFTPAEKNPGAFHGVSTFDFETVEDPDVAPDESFSVEFGKSILKLAYINKKICTITAAMKYGTGLQFFHKKLPDRFFDVGMAEQHAVTFATGLAKGGMLPVVCIYSTFLQRAYDQIIHDVCLQNANVLFVIDRAGLVPNDGETHQGIYDVAFLSQHSNLRIVCPSNYAELSYWLGQFTDVNNVGPRAIRLPRGKEKEALAKLSVTKNEFDVIKNGDKTKTAIISYGAMVEEAILAQNALDDKKINVDVIKLNIINPLPCGFIDTVVGYKNVVFLEDSIENGSVAQKTAVKLLHENFGGKYIIKAMPTRGIDHATVEELRVQNGLDCESICKLIESGEKF